MILSTIVRNALDAVKAESSQNLILSHFGGELPNTNNTQALQSLLSDLVIASDLNWKAETLEALDLVYSYAYEERRPTFIDYKSIPSQCKVGETEIAVHLGDITALQIDAIVNAANDQGLGCFIPAHRCIDNVIHRHSGPKLRAACRAAMAARGTSLDAGTVPMVTDAFNLPSQKIIHVTGPQIQGSQPPTQLEKQQLAFAYWSSLDACVQHNLKSIAFCGISTGLFGFPKAEAAEIATDTVFKWLGTHPGVLDTVVFDVFSDEDKKVYKEVNKKFPKHRGAGNGNTVMLKSLSLHNQKLATAKEALSQADYVLICAGAGMSVKKGESVYTNPDDFQKHYPWFANKWQYHTSYEAMGLMSDPRVPDEAKWAFQAKHMDNMRWSFTPNEGYTHLLNLVKDKDYFVLTSNVDGCFERAGFNPSRIYTPQGEWTFYQCVEPCRQDAVFESRPLLDQLLPLIGNDGMLPKEVIPKCPYCGGKVFGNVRGGSWFLHTLYDQQNESLRDWMQKVLATQGKKVVLIEIGAGFNTPTVTRFPMESFARDLGDRGVFLRINPSDSQIPEDLKAISIEEGWETLGDIVSSKPFNHFKRIAAEQVKNGETTNIKQTHKTAMYFGHFSWEKFLENLKH